MRETLLDLSSQAGFELDAGLVLAFFQDFEFQKPVSRQR
jgi:hypothetical protein